MNKNFKAYLGLETRGQYVTLETAILEKCQAFELGSRSQISLSSEWQVVGGERKWRRQILTCISGRFYSKEGDKGSGMAQTQMRETVLQIFFHVIFKLLSKAFHTNLRTSHQ